MPDRVRSRPSLRARLAAGVLGFSVLLGATLLVQGHWIHESVEQRAWQALLQAERDVLVERFRGAPGSALPDAGSLRGWLLGGQGAGPIGPELAGLAPGVHHRVRDPRTGQVLAVLVEDLPGGRLVLALDITDLEQAEGRQAVWLLVSALLATLLLGAVAWWLGGRLVGPLRRLSAQVDALQPAAIDQRLGIADGEGREIAAIAEAFNGYLRRHDGFVARERSFVDSVGHELRTPVAVITGAADVLAQRVGSDPALRTPLRRITQAAGGIDQLLRLLLVLAKEPARLRAGSDVFDLEDLLPDLVEDHRHLCVDKALTLALGTLAPSRLQAPAAIVHVAIGNLLRNAIENSDGGCVRVEVEPAGVVSVSDPGSGLGADEIGRLYAQRARRGDGRGAGLGLALIGRICDHLGWTLAFEPGPDGGTRARLDLRGSLAAPAGDH